MGQRTVGHPDKEPVTVLREPARSDLAASLLDSYFVELASRLPGGLQAHPAHAASPAELSPPSGVFLVVYLDGGAVGCGGLRKLDATTAEIKHMWVDPSARGRGIGRKLVAALEESASSLSCDVVRLDTSAHLGEAIALYRSSQYREIAPYNENPYAAHWFEKRLGM